MSDSSTDNTIRRSTNKTCLYGYWQNVYTAIGIDGRFHPAKLRGGVHPLPFSGKKTKQAFWRKHSFLVGLTMSMLFLLSGYALAEQFGIPRRSSEISAAASTSMPNPALSAVSMQPNLPVYPAQPAPAIASRSEIPPAAPHETSLPIPNVVRLISFDKNGRSFGSGSYIGNSGEYGIILSNWHVVCEADGLVHVHFPGGFSTYGAVVLSDKKWDLATIVVSKPPQSVQPLPIAKVVPKPGDPLWIAGHGSGVYRLAEGRCVRYLAPEIPANGMQPQYEIVELSVSARQGDSGGPILNQKGELAGVLFGSDMVQNTAGSFCKRVHQFLEQTVPYLLNLPTRPESYFASIEQNGPRRDLKKSLYSAPASGIASVAARNEEEGIDSPVSPVEIRSVGRRNSVSVPSTIHVIERKGENLNLSPAIPSSSVKSQVETPSESTLDSTSFRDIQTAVWNKSKIVSRLRESNSTDLSPYYSLSSGVRQTGFAIKPMSHSEVSQSFSDTENTIRLASNQMLPIQADQPSEIVTVSAIVPKPYTSRTIQEDSFNPVLRFGSILIVFCLVFQAFRLLYGMPEKPEEDFETESGVFQPAGR